MNGCTPIWEGLGIGAVVIPVYPTLLPEEIEYILNNSETKVIVVENRVRLDKVLKIVDSCPALEKIVVMEEGDTPAHPKVMAFTELMEKDRTLHGQEPGLFEQLSADVTQDDLATIVYTSGTTGLPKDAMISHGNIFFRRPVSRCH